MKRAFLAQAFFNPLWIARHLAFIQWFSGRGAEIGWELVTIGLHAFLYALPVALAVNYGIQNGLPLHWRFIASAIFPPAWQSIML